jgi:hypothetical protein
VTKAAAPFLERAHAVVLGLGVASLLFGLVWAVVGAEGGALTTHGADGFSRSAIGFRAFRELLQSQGIPVVESRFRSAQRVGPDDVLVLAAPAVSSESDSHDAQLLDGLLAGAHRVVVILPKWRTTVHDDAAPERPTLTAVAPVDAGAVALLVEKVAPGAELAAADAPSFPIDALGARPELDHAVLLRDSPLTPLVAADEGVLVGMSRDGPQRRIVLSDPDPVSNHGIGRGENAALALALVEAVRGEGGSVVFDETLHGLEAVPSVWHEFGRPPLQAGTAYLIFVLFAAIAAGAVRFGRPQPLASGWREGKEALLDNVAGLMERLRHASYAAARYFDATVDELAESLHAPRDLARSELLAWLRARLPAAKAQEFDALVAAAHAARKESTPAAALACAARIHRFREEVLHGAR